MCGQIVVKNACVREPGYLYYISGSGDLCRSVMSHGGRKKGSGKKKPTAVKPSRKANLKKLIKKVNKKVTVKKVAKVTKKGKRK